ncbi:MAG: response regulator [Synechococcales cyanobacterium C42_A2020_086]|jgi:PAS domain S-box-containing protein|nr:response regulator [Synechococcales cyanobacterium C42_A2020_086]
MVSEPVVNVLLVDDHPENLIALEAILAQLGQNLVKAESGEEALRCLLHQDFAVILLDVQMPGMDGLETAALIRQRQRSRNTPIIFLTAFNTNSHLISKGYSLGAVDYLHKPIDSAILTSKVAVFVELFKKTLEVERQTAQLETINAELKHSEERFRLLSRCSPVGIFLTDTTGICTYTNPNCQAICGSRLAAGHEIQWSALLHPEDRGHVLRGWLSCLQQRQDYSGEFRLLSESGLRWVHMRTAPMLSEQGELLGHIGTIEDMTDHKQAEQVQAQIIREQAARQQAEAANRMKDEFLAMVSHELRTPLNSILGWSQLLLSRRLDEPTITRALQTIERNARSQAQLIEDILDVSQIIGGKLRLNMQTVQLVPLIASVLETFRPLANEKSIELIHHLDPTVGPVVGDPERLRQMIWNLLSNALKFTAAHGRIEIRLTQTTCTAHREDSPPRERHSHQGAAQADYTQQPVSPSWIEMAQIQIIDSGIGIRADVLPHIFERFRQADSTTTRSYGGLGLGLAIVRHLVEQHGGEVLAESDGEGQGATFTLRLPLRCLQPEPTEQPEPTHEPTHEPTIVPPSSDPLSCPLLAEIQILVVEDHADTRDYIAMVLEQSGAQVTAVASVREALHYLEQTNPDVLISDLGLPQEDGYALIRTVRNREPHGGNRIPAIALTAYVRAEDQRQALAAGFELHVPKPVEPNELIAVVAKAVGQH